MFRRLRHRPVHTRHSPVRTTPTSPTRHSLTSLDSALNLWADRFILFEVGDEGLVLEIKRDERTGVLYEEGVAAVGEEVEGHEGVFLLGIHVVAGNLEGDETAARGGFGVVDDFDAFADLEEGGDGFVVFLVDAGDDAFDGGEEVAPGDGDGDERVAEGEGGEDFAAGDGAGVNVGADAAGVDDCEVGGFGAFGGEHGVGHDVAEEAFGGFAGEGGERDGGVAEDDGGEFGEGGFPGGDLGLERGVLGAGVGEVDGGAVVGEDLAGGGVGHVDVAEVFSPAVGGDDKDFFAVEVLGDGGVFGFGAFHVA